MSTLLGRAKPPAAPLHVSDSLHRMQDLQANLAKLNVSQKDDDPGVGVDLAAAVRIRW